MNSLCVIMAFRGWPDARRVATYSAEYLVETLDAVKVGEVDSTIFYDFTIQRPIVNIERGLLKDYRPPVNELYRATSSGMELLIFIGVEPHMNWSAYSQSIFKMFESEKVSRICLLGGLIDRVPHTVEPLVSGLATTPDLVEELKHHGVEPTDYLGPSSIHSLILDECKRMGLPAMSIWGHSPEYVMDVDAMTAHQLLSKVRSLMNIDVDLTRIRRESEELSRRLDDLMVRNGDFSQLVSKLELEYKSLRRKPNYIA
ncbi:PAC2 family protein [Candidatus Bathyarchaeota archaeon]|nr:PAC2 family protein [Candidatus Bathyarchaeota archaeon]